MSLPLFMRTPVLLSEPTLLTSFNPAYLPKGPISKGSGSEGSGFQHMTPGRVIILVWYKKGLDSGKRDLTWRGRLHLERVGQGAPSPGSRLMDQHTLSFTQRATGGEGGGSGRHYSRVAWLNPGGHESPDLPYEGQGRLLGGAS